MAKKPKAGPERSDDLKHEATQPTTGKKTKQQNVEEWLTKAYNFRYNTIKQKPEYKEFKTGSKWQAIDKYKLLSIKRELDATGLEISSGILLEILCSSYSPQVNPVKQFFEELPAWNEDQPDYINQLCATIKCRNSNDWKLYLKKWLVAVVANIYIDERCANHTMLVLTGEQGKYKTTWLENLVPRGLSQYNYTGKLNLENKDCLTYIAEYMFVNIDDQLKQLHKKDENELKNLITINNVKYRRPYDPIITEYPHLCSFMASVNGNDFLSDPTGSRRFLPFEVENIFIEKAQQIDINAMWSQAKYYFKTGFQYWFNSAEVEVLNKRNEVFSMVSIEEELIQNYYRSKPLDRVNGIDSERILYLTPAMLLVDLENKTRQRLNKRKLGEALHKLNYIKKQRTLEGKIQWVWQVVEKSTEAREKEQLNEITE